MTWSKAKTPFKEERSMNEKIHNRPRLRLLFADQHDDAAASQPEFDQDLAAEARRFQRVEGVIFDMGDVLFDATAWRRWLLQILRRLGMQAGYRSLFNLWDRDYLDGVHRGERDYAEAFVSFLRDAGLSAGQIDEVVAASQQCKQRLEADSRLFPGVRETLETLQSQGRRLGVLSDSESSAEVIRERLDRFGIGACFTSVVSSVDLGHTKPHPLGYQTAMKQLSLTPQRTVFVGHDAEELHGARRCGVKTVAFNYDREASADCRVGGFSDLLLLLGDNAGDEVPIAKAA
jgi:HAD superfamily hydrolase (TIGR01509 family)